MIDRGLFLGMNGTKDSMFQLDLAANNLANANTVGFRADYAIAKVEAQHDSLGSRINTSTERVYSDFTPGPIVETGRELDIAIEGKGFIAVQSKDGREGYTRAGNLQMNEDGYLVTIKGELVLGDSGPISIPTNQRVSIDKHGGISALLAGGADVDYVLLDTIKLVDAPIDKLRKGQDGLFYLPDGETAKVSDEVRVIREALEGSNVNTVKSMVDLIDISRKFEIHTKLMKAIEDNSMRSNQLLHVQED